MPLNLRRAIGYLVAGMAVVTLAVGCAPAGLAAAGAPNQAVSTAAPQSSAPEAPSASSTAAAQITPAPPTVASTQPPVGTAVGMQAPDFSLTTLDGKTAHLSDYRGQVVLLNFWATWCPPCRIEIPGLVSAYQHYKGQGFTIVAVNMQEPKDTVASFAGQQHMDFPILLDGDGSAASMYVGRGIPTSYLIDRNGVVRQVVVGSMPDETINQLVQSLVDSAT